ncbi:MAG: AsmA family protein [Gammaproteobacteria bacterium]|nr:AsmA family protein [Gammaproteobacteria bacterium]
MIRPGLKILLALILILVITAISLPFIIDPNDYKDEITQQVKQHTGRTLHIPGEIKLSLFPWLGLQLGEVKLENASGFQPAHFAQISEVDVRVQFWPLFKGNIQIGQVVLQGLILNLQRNADGHTNWDDLTKQAPTDAVDSKVPAPEKPEATPKSAPATSTEPPLAALAALSIEGVRVENANVHWIDKTTNQDIRIENIQLTLGAVSLTEKIPLELSFAFNSVEPAIQSQLHLSTNIQLDLEKQIYTLSQLVLTPDIRTEIVPGTVVKGKLSIDNLNADLSTQKMTMSGINSNFNYQLKEPVIAGQLTLATNVFMDLNKQQFALNKLTLQNTVTSDLIPGGKNQVQVNSAKIKLDLAKEKLNTENLNIETYNIKLQSRLRVNQLLSKPHYLVSLESNEFNLNELLNQLKLSQALPPMADKTALNKVKLGARIIGSMDEVLLKPMILQIDQSNLQGYASIKNFKQPEIRYQLVLNDIDVDRYLPPPSKDKPENKQNKNTPTPITNTSNNTDSTKRIATPATAAASAASTLPTELLRSLNIDGLLKVGNIKVMNLKASDIQLGTQAKQGQLKLNPIKANLYQGSFTGNAGLDVRKDTPILTATETLKGIQIGPLLKDFMGDDMVRGQADLSANIRAHSIDPVEIRQTLNGTTRFKITDGEIKDIDIEQIDKNLNEIDNDIKAIFSNLKNLSEVEKQLNRIKAKWKAVAGESTGKSTYFSRMSGSANIKNGLVRNQDLRTDFPYGRARGEGQINLVNETMDYTAFVKLTSKVKVKEGKTYEQLDRIPLKIYLQGPFSGLVPRPDFSGYIKEAGKHELKQVEARLKNKAKAKIAEEKQKAREKLEQEKKALEEKTKQQLEDKARDALKKLFKF